MKETIDWRRSEDAVPQDGEVVATVYVAPSGQRVRWLGWYDAGVWRDLDNLELLPPTWWAPLFNGPVEPAQPEEMIRWRRSDEERPNDDATVLMVHVAGGETALVTLLVTSEVGTGYLDGDRWYDITGMPILPPAWWAPMLTGPGVAP